MGDSDTPTPGSSVLVRARMITDLSVIVYPPGIKPPAVQGDHNRRYDREFLLQFATLCTAKPDALPADIMAVVTVASPEIVHRRATSVPGAMAKQIPVPGRPGYYYPPMAARFMSQGPRFVPQAPRAPQPQRQHISPGMATMPVPLIFRMRPQMFDTLTSPTAPTATTPTVPTTSTSTTSTSTSTSSTVTPTSPTAPPLNSGASAFVPRPRKVSIKDESGAEVDLEQLAKQGTAASPSKVVVRMETEEARVQRLAEEKVQLVEQVEKTICVAEKQKESAVMRNVARMDIPQAQAWRLDEDAEWAQLVEAIALNKALPMEMMEAKENERREKKPIGAEEQDVKAALNSAKPENASWNIGVDEMMRLDVARRWAEENGRLEQVGAVYAVLKREAARHAEAAAEKWEEEERTKKELRDAVEAAKRDIEDMRQKYDEGRREAEAREAAMMELLCDEEHERVKKRLTRDEKARTATTSNCPAGTSPNRSPSQCRDGTRPTGKKDEEEQVRREEDQKRCEEEQDRRKEKQYVRDEEQDQRDEELNRREKLLQRRDVEQIKREKELRRREAELRRREEELARREEDLEPCVWPDSRDIIINLGGRA